MELLFGDLHNHCGITYGYGALHHALDNAAAHLDFAAITGHAMWPDMPPRNAETAFVIDFHEAGFAKLREHWDEVRAQVAARNGQGLITLQSYEMHSSRYGDHHLLSPDDHVQLIYRDSPAELVRDCGAEAIAIPHHVGYVPGYRGISWADFDESISPFVEVHSKHGNAMRANGPFAYYHDMGPRDPRNTVQEGLRQGKRFSFAGSTDHHAGFPGAYGDGLTAVWADGRTRGDLWRALRSGRLYALTGDKMICHLTVNDVPMGAQATGTRRTVACRIQGEARIARVMLYKNGELIDVQAPLPAQRPLQRAKLRLEMGWGNDEAPFRWEGSLHVKDGQLLNVHPYYRGRSVLSPTQHNISSADDMNKLDNRLTYNGQQAQFITETLRNVSTLHPLTNQYVFDVAGDENTQVTLTINGVTKQARLRDIVRCGWGDQVKPWHSQAWLMHTAVTALEFTFEHTWQDDKPQRDADCYHVECEQENGQWAFLSPVYAHA